MQHLQQVAPHAPHVAVLLDQEKAYHRVYPQYLQQTLFRFGFPTSLVDTLMSLFFGTQIHIGINVWLGAPIP